jgi:hypothetical protein
MLTERLGMLVDLRKHESRCGSQLPWKTQEHYVGNILLPSFPRRDILEMSLEQYRRWLESQYGPRQAYDTLRRGIRTCLFTEKGLTCPTVMDPQEDYMRLMTGVPEDILSHMSRVCIGRQAYDPSFTKYGLPGHPVYSPVI